MSDENVSKWLYENLSKVLSFPVPRDLIDYILTIENERDIEDYMKTLLDMKDPIHLQFFNNFKIVRQFGHEPEKSSVPYVKATNESTDSGNRNKKKKSKFVNLYSSDGSEKDVVLLKGRHYCDCQGSKHKLVNNCLNCGRIVCQQEGSGPCLFCGMLVCSQEEQDLLSNLQEKESHKLYTSLMNVERPEGWEKALAQRDRLLHYDKSSQKRTKVIDDEGEYFSTNSVWLSAKERERLEQKQAEMQKRKHASRRNCQFTLDFAGRQIIREHVDDNLEKHDDDIESSFTESFSQALNIYPDIKLLPQYIEPDESRADNGKIRNTSDKVMSSLRVQDRELLEMSDAGMCLSLHQPWASLLVHGIMRHEGRTWYSAHRGRLWIAAASKAPSEIEIREVETFFKLIRNDEDLIFPLNYPTSCLLGCVTIVDCLPQEDYQIKFQEGESSSPFVFICQDAHALSLKFPISGQHKIYKLDSKIHQAAQKALQRQMSNNKMKQ